MLGIVHACLTWWQVAHLESGVWWHFDQIVGHRRGTCICRDGLYTGESLGIVVSLAVQRAFERVVTGCQPLEELSTWESHVARDRAQQGTCMWMHPVSIVRVLVAMAWPGTYICLACVAHTPPKKNPPKKQASSSNEQ